MDEYLSFRLNAGSLPAQNSEAGEWMRVIEMFDVSNAPIDSDEYRASMLMRIPAHVIDQLAERAGLSNTDARRLPMTSLIDAAAKQESGRKGSPVPAAGDGEPVPSVDSLLGATDKDASLYRDGNQWCDVQYAKMIGVSSSHIDRVRKPKGVYGVRLTERRKADTIGKPFVYRRSELNELSEAIPDDRKADL